MANGEMQEFGVDIETAAKRVEQVLTIWQESDNPGDQLTDCDVSTKVHFDDTPSSAVVWGGVYGHVEADVKVGNHKPVRVGVFAVETHLKPFALEFNKGEKHWDYDPSKKPPKFVRRTLKALGATGIFTQIDKASSEYASWPEEVRVEAAYHEARENRKR